MSHGLYRTVTMREHGLWVSKRMCGDHELFRGEALTRDEARHNLKLKWLPDLVKTAFKKR